MLFLSRKQQRDVHSMPVVEVDPALHTRPGTALHASGHAAVTLLKPATVPARPGGQLVQLELPPTPNRPGGAAPTHGVNEGGSSDMKIRDKHSGHTSNTGDTGHRADTPPGLHLQGR